MFHTIDGFFDDPVAERKKALESEFKTVLHNAISYPNIAVCEDALHTQRLASVLSLRGSDLSGPAFVYYRANLARDKEPTYIHSDSRLGTYTAVASLTPRELCVGGTAFWRHKKYGWEAQPTKQELFSVGLADTEMLWKEIYEDGFSEEKWELLGVAPMAWNRACVFASVRFHSRYPRTCVSDELSTARLVKVYFLNPSSSLRVRKLQPEIDYNEISRWWELRKWPALPVDHLSSFGVIAEDADHKYCAAWVYRTDSRWGLLEWVVTNPDSPARKRLEALNFMLKTLKEEARDLGIKTLFTSVKAHGLISVLKKHGFQVTDQSMTNLTIRL